MSVAPTTGPISRRSAVPSTGSVGELGQLLQVLQRLIGFAGRGPATRRRLPGRREFLLEVGDPEVGGVGLVMRRRGRGPGPIQLASELAVVALGRLGFSGFGL